MFEPREDGKLLHYPFCDVCGRVLTEEDHTDEAGSDGDVHWCSYWHSPAGLEELAGVEAYLAFREEEVKTESLNRLKAIIDAAVGAALAARGLA